MCAQTLYASPQAVVVHAENLVVETERRIALVDLTDTVSALVQRTPVSEGSISLWPLHTTCVVLVNELQTALVSDVWSFLEQLAPREHAWMHNNPAFSDCDRFNADSNQRSSRTEPDAADLGRRGRARPLAAHPAGRAGLDRARARSRA